MNLKTLIIAAAAFFTSGVSQAATIATWDMTGQPGDQTVMVASNLASGLQAATLSRGAGLNATTGTDSFSSSGWSGSEADDYLSLSLSVAEGYLLNLDWLAIGTRASNTGPGSIGVFSSLDGFSSPLQGIAQNGGEVVASLVDLSGLGTLTGNLELRLYELGNTQADGSGDTSAAGTFRVVNSTGGFTRFEGELQLTPVPLPASLWLFGSALAALGMRGRSTSCG
ncbi:hypothetical protein [Haliea sp. E17]|uniref:hypothetical protein n=1 Tax=Haliea sp. E17 TaxID=3401576 RepID=UPI003AB000D2